jgi:VanZ family protein
MILTIISWVLTLAQASAIFYVSSLSSVGLPMFWQSDKVFHAIAYAALAFLFSWSLSRYITSWKRIIIFSFIASTLYGMSDEFHQLFVPNRQSDFFDLVADAFGSLAGTVLFVKMHFSKNLRKGFER